MKTKQPGCFLYITQQKRVRESDAHLLSMSWTEEMPSGSNRVPSVSVLARKTGLNSLNGSRSVCQVPASVSKLQQKAMPSQLASVRRMHLMTYTKRSM